MKRWIRTLRNLIWPTVSTVRPQVEFNRITIEIPIPDAHAGARPLEVTFERYPAGGLILETFSTMGLTFTSTGHSYEELLVKLAMQTHDYWTSRNLHEALDEQEPTRWRLRVYGLGDGLDTEVGGIYRPVQGGWQAETLLRDHRLFSWGKTRYEALSKMQRLIQGWIELSAQQPMWNAQYAVDPSPWQSVTDYSCVPDEPVSYLDEEPELLDEEAWRQIAERLQNFGRDGAS